MNTYIICIYNLIHFQGLVDYRLVGVIVHHGSSIHSGHYIAYVQAANSMWYEMDDSSVTQVSSNRVLQQQAYILFYVRNTAPVVSVKDDIVPKPFGASTTTTPTTALTTASTTAAAKLSSDPLLAASITADTTADASSAEPSSKTTDSSGKTTTAPHQSNSNDDDDVGEKVVVAKKAKLNPSNPTTATAVGALATASATLPSSITKPNGADPKAAHTATTPSNSQATKTTVTPAIQANTPISLTTSSSSDPTPASGASSDCDEEEEEVQEKDVALNRRRRLPKLSMISPHRYGTHTHSYIL